MPWLATLDRCEHCAQKHVMSEDDARRLSAHTKERSGGQWAWLEAFACPMDNEWHIRRVEADRKEPAPGS